MTAIENPDGAHSSVTYDFISLTPTDEHATDIPLCSGCVRAINLGSRWTFTSLDDGRKTKIEMDMAVDPQSPNLSTFFINKFQKSWPHVSVHGLVKSARHHLHRDGDIQVTNTFFRLFPLKI